MGTRTTRIAEYGLMKIQEQLTKQPPIQRTGRIIGPYLFDAENLVIVNGELLRNVKQLCVVKIDG